MKYFLIVWLCVNDPNVSLEKTCEQVILDKASYNTMYECAADGADLYKQLKPMGNVYLTTFCSLKPAV